MRKTRTPVAREASTAVIVTRTAAMLAAMSGTVLVLWSEHVTWRASFDAVPLANMDPAARGDADVALVLGFRSSGHGRTNAIQRWRVRIAVRSVDPRRARFVFSGGATRGGVSEAALMARYAVEDLGVPASSVALEEQSRTTWENISFSIPLLTEARSIVIASNTFHARRARRYLATQSPELAARVRRGADYRFGELLLLKPYLAIYEWRRSQLRLDS
jgi:uncharacterized SAM-binding protein YcdF (DUF218 family)